MNTGFYISGALHTAFIAFLLFGGLFARDRLPPVSVADVTVLSEEEFAALVPAATAPEIATDAPSQVLPDQQPPPDVPEEEAPPERSEPSVADEPDAPEPVPDPPELAPTPPAELTDSAPILAPPSQVDEVAAVTPDAAPAPAPRVAPEAAPPPPIEAEIAPEVAPEVASEPDAPPTDIDVESDATAPEEATTEIVTEAEERERNAPTASVRPRARPDRPVQNEARSSEIAQPDETAIAAAVDQANAATQPSGPPLTSGEKDAFRISVQRCWVVDVGSEASNVTVVVGFELSQDGRVVDGTLIQIEASGGSETAINTAFQSARRAILRCGASGYDLPVDKYDQWREIEITFNPEGMRLR